MKNILLLCIIVITTNLAFAQNNTYGFNILLKGGLTCSNMYGPDVLNETFLNGDSPETFYANHPASSKFKNGTNYGLLLDYRFGKYFSLGIGANYIQKGAKINASEHWNNTLQTYDNVTGKIYWIQNFWTIETPITVYLPIKQNEIYLQGGLSFGNLINSKEQGNIEISGKKYSYTNERGANNKEQGFFIGGGYIYSLPNKIGDIIIELIWNRSIIKSYGSNMIPNPQYYYNQTFSLNIGYKYNLKLKK